MMTMGSAVHMPFRMGAALSLFRPRMTAAKAEINAKSTVPPAKKASIHKRMKANTLSITITYDGPPLVPE